MMPIAAMALFLSLVYVMYFSCPLYHLVVKVDPRILTGRVMSVLMLMSMGLLPIADAITVLP